MKPIPNSTAKNAFDILMRRHITPPANPPPADILPQYKLMFDGGSRGNPGPCGAGVSILKNNVEIAAISHFIPGEHTNNYAEYTALIMGLEKTYQLKIKSLTVEGDSKLVINQCKGIWRIKSNSLLHLNQYAKKLINQFDYIHLKHISRDFNQRADQLANQAMDSNLHL